MRIPTTLKTWARPVAFALLAFSALGAGVIGCGVNDHIASLDKSAASIDKTAANLDKSATNLDDMNKAITEMAKSITVLSKEMERYRSLSGDIHEVARALTSLEGTVHGLIKVFADGMFKEAPPAPTADLDDILKSPDAPTTPALPLPRSPGESAP